MIIWQVAREYAHLAEAGGVKNVVCSLCEGLVKLNHEVTLFIPLYGCSDLTHISEYKPQNHMTTEISVAEKKYQVSFATGKLHKINIVFVIASCFTEKLGVYTYTAAEEAKNPQFTRGKGHFDAVENEIMFQKAVIHYGKNYGLPNVIHCHDATTALIPALANIPENKPYFSKTKFVATIHNAGAGYHHEIENLEKAKYLTDIPEDILKLGLVESVVEPYLLASYFATLTTVSPWYAEEITNPENNDTQGLSKAFYDKKIKVFGITNGIDFEKYNPVNLKKSHLPYRYNPQKADLEGKIKARMDFFHEFGIATHSHKKNCLKINFEDSISQHGYLDAFDENTTIFSYHGRLVHQKGLDILEKAIPICLEKDSNIRFVIIGQGDRELEKKQIELANRYSGKVLYLKGYHRALARICVAISDFIVLPSFFEPCGLEDFIASILGTIPLAHKTGGLQKIVHNKTGFLYSPNNENELAKNIFSLIDFKNNHHLDFIKMIKTASKTVYEDYNWENVIKNYYLLLYV